MPTKRSRIFKSSSFGESSGVLTGGSRLEISGKSRAAPLKPPRSSAKIPKPTAEVEREEQQQQRPRILTLSSPVQGFKRGSGGASEEGEIGKFLEKCYYCKKNMGENHEVFMYSYLRAFCTSECRDKQIAMDKDLEGVSEIMAEQCKVSKWRG